jgi:hypothetical protein
MFFRRRYVEDCGTGTYKYDNRVRFTQPSLDHLFIQPFCFLKRGRRAITVLLWYMNENAIHRIENQHTALSHCHMLNLRFTRGLRVNVFCETTSECGAEEYEREGMIRRTTPGEVAYELDLLAKRPVNSATYWCSSSVTYTRAD